MINYFAFFLTLKSRVFVLQLIVMFPKKTLIFLLTLLNCFGILLEQRASVKSFKF